MEGQLNDSEIHKQEETIHCRYLRNSYSKQPTILKQGNRSVTDFVSLLRADHFHRSFLPPEQYHTIPSSPLSNIKPSFSYPWCNAEIHALTLRLYPSIFHPLTVVLNNLTAHPLT